MHICFGKRSLWTDILRARYLENKSFFERRVKKGASLNWKGIYNSREAILQGACFRIGNGQSINPRKDPWVPWISGFVPKLKAGVDGSPWRCVADLKLHGPRWNMDLIHNICEPESAMTISKLEWHHFNYQDSLLWTGNHSRKFSVKECYLTANKRRFNLEARDFWKNYGKEKCIRDLKCICGVFL